MIIFKNPISVLTRSDKPYENWTDETDIFVVDDNGNLGKKVLASQPFFDFVLNKKNELIDITPTERPAPPPPAPTQTEILQQTVADLESQNTDLMLAIAEMAEATEQSKMETQIAIAELAEIIAGGA